MQEEGYIKFQCFWTKKSLPEDISIHEINTWREKLFKHKLIGAYPDGVGYGNISTRLTDNTFLITGTKTGKLAEVTKEHFTIVTGFDIVQNQVTCKGPIMASSESLTHAIIYESLPEVNAVVHIHNEFLWKRHINKAPTTSAQADYGTPEMAEEIKRLLNSDKSKSNNFIVMAGHKDGLVSYGNDLSEAINYFL